MSGHFELLTLPTAQPKLVKGMTKGVMTFSLMLAPARLSGWEMCAGRSPACTAACLNTAGHGGIIKIGEQTNAVQEARKRKTRWFMTDREAFMAAMVRDCFKAKAYAERRGYDVAYRPNCLSDQPWHRMPLEHEGLRYPNLMELFPEDPWYDYTKVFKRLAEDKPRNYHLTFSLSETNELEARQALDAGHNVAVVFRDRPTVEHTMEHGWFGHPVIDGDETDLRYLDPAPSIIALKAKGKARKDTSGFVRDIFSGLTQLGYGERT